jgi:two-component system NarL family sensor kinase
MGVELKNIFLAFGLSGLFLALVALYFFWNLYQQQKKFRDLQFQKINAEIKAIEIERMRLSTELHNDIAPTLASVKMRLGLIKNESSDLMNELEKALNSSIVQIRGIMHELTPLTIYELPFQDILKQYIDSRSLKELIQIEFKDETDFILKSEKNNQVFRIIQEIIQNTVKHANAKTLKIQLLKENNFLLIRTADDGIGYDFEKIKSANKLGLGLLGIFSRVEYLNGTIISPENTSKGTKYNIRIPI